MEFCPWIFHRGRNVKTFCLCECLVQETAGSDVENKWLQNAWSSGRYSDQAIQGLENVPRGRRGIKSPKTRRRSVKRFLLFGTLPLCSWITYLTSIEDWTIHSSVRYVGRVGAHRVRPIKESYGIVGGSWRTCHFPQWYGCCSVMHALMVR